MIQKIINNLPIIGGAGGSVTGVIQEEIVRTNTITFEQVMIFICFTVIGAVVGYLIKTVLDMLEVDKKIKELKDKLTNFKK